MQDLCKTAGKTADGKGARATFLHRHPETGYVEPITTDYDGPVPPKVWKRLNRRFLKLDAARYFYPLDGLDAYHDALVEIERTAQKLSNGELALTKASPETYLANVGSVALLHFHQRRVQPTRTTYRAVERRTIGKGATGEDGFDIDNHDGTADNPGKAMADACKEPCEESVPVGSALTAQQLAEQLPGCPSARERRLRAALALEDVYRALLASDHRAAVRAFRAYVRANGNMLEAAHLAGIGKTVYYGLWPYWLEAARDCAENIVCNH